MRFKPTPFLAALALAGLSACQTSDDPRKGGFFGGVAALSSGTYDKRLEQRENRLETLKSEREMLEERLRARQQERARVQQEKADMLARLRAGERELVNLSIAIEEASQQTRIDQTRLAQIKAEAAKLEEQRQLLEAEAEAGRVSEVELNAQVTRLDEERTELQKKLDEALSLAVGLSND